VSVLVMMMQKQSQHNNARLTRKAEDMQACECVALGLSCPTLHSLALGIPSKSLPSRS
jgi:hypothetical protein